MKTKNFNEDIQIQQKEQSHENHKNEIRSTLKQDQKVIIGMMKATQVFKDEEIEIAEELLKEYYSKPNSTDYRFFSFIENEKDVCGFACFGSTHITNGTYDFYWLVVSPHCQGKGVGTKLLQYVEQTIKEEGGRIILVETSSTDTYSAARRFYEYRGYKQLAKIQAYYDVHDDLVIYGKYF